MIDNNALPNGALTGELSEQEKEYIVNDILSVKETLEFLYNEKAHKAKEGRNMT